MKNKLLAMASLAMAVSTNPEMRVNIPVSRLQEFEPYKNRICKSCKNINRNIGKEKDYYCTCTGRYENPKSKACKNYKPRKK